MSPIYKEAQQTLFPEWPKDFRTHLKAFADPKVQKVLSHTSQITFGRYKGRVAALSGGENQMSTSRITGAIAANLPALSTDGLDIPIPLPATTLNYARVMIQNKMIELSRRHKLGKVDIIDLEPDQPASDAIIE